MESRKLFLCQFPQPEGFFVCYPIGQLVTTKDSLTKERALKIMDLTVTETVSLYPKIDDKNLLRLSNLKALACPLCELALEKEKIYYENKSFIVLRTKTLKGHRERIMIVYRQHEHTIPYKAYEHALDLVSKIGRKVFSYTPKFAILDTTFATINDHWHLVATDLDPKSEDFNQILATKWIKVIDNTITEEVEI